MFLACGSCKKLGNSRIHKNIALLAMTKLGIPYRDPRVKPDDDREF
ncbi:hypothetical protein [Campylobacter sp.]|nr:hypothetical protein [Campylobacter sp.]MCI7447655.1 hypothetical protein [Campylobacter sp.]